MTLPTSSNNAVRKYALATELLSTLRGFARELVRFYDGREVTSLASIEVVDPNPPQQPWFRRLFPSMKEQATKRILGWMVYDASLAEGLIEIYVEAASGDTYVSQRTILPSPPKKLGLTELMDYSVDELLDLLSSFSKDARGVTNALSTMR